MTDKCASEDDMMVFNARSKATSTYMSVCAVQVPRWVIFINTSFVQALLHERRFLVYVIKRDGYHSFDIITACSLRMQLRPWCKATLKQHPPLSLMGSTYEAPSPTEADTS